ncbi:acyltransferase [Aurantimonas sp. Leaf443]|uniref:acyltransferase family protein n=1 Tax=Aurantimonas sp. Leaf443 TaxID=1736378 RepID=UPI00138F518A|nr:acyltransferase [Aurantimonas sp. Leaf443]
MQAARNVPIQWLRALAALEVMVWHSDLLTKRFSDASIQDSLYRPFGGVGVEVFFVVSGFLMALVTAGRPGAASFVAGRVRRLVPLYWAFTSLVILAFVINPRWHLADFEPAFAPIASAYLFLPQTGFPVLPVGWTLEYEVLFYALVAGFLLLAPAWKPGRAAFALLLAGLGLLGVLFPGLDTVSPWLGHLATPYFFGFALGWSLQVAGEGGPGAAILPVVSAMLAAAALLAGPEAGHLVWRIALAGLLVALAMRLGAGLAAPGRGGRWLATVGEASYSIYLSHWFVLSIVGKLAGAADLPAGADVPLRIAGCLLAVIVGTGLYRLVEHPLDRRLRRLGWRGLRPSLPTPAALLTYLGTRVARSDLTERVRRP